MQRRAQWHWKQLRGRGRCIHGCPEGFSSTQRRKWQQRLLHHSKNTCPEPQWLVTLDATHIGCECAQPDAGELSVNTLTCALRSPGTTHKKNWRREPFEWLVFWPMGFSFCQMLLSFDFLSIWSDKLVTLELLRCRIFKWKLVLWLSFISSSDGTCCELDHKIKSWNVGSISFIVHYEFLFSSIVCFTVFPFILRPNVYQIDAASAGNQVCGLKLKHLVWGSHWRAFYKCISKYILWLKQGICVEVCFINATLGWLEAF